MKVLQVGTKFYQPSYIYKCDRCECKFQFFEWECGKIDKYLTLNCPQCNKEIRISNLEYYKEC